MTCPIVANVCIYGESTESYCVAIVCPGKTKDPKELEALLENSKTTLTYNNARTKIGIICQKSDNRIDLIRFD